MTSASTAPSDQKLSLAALVALVIGSMVVAALAGVYGLVSGAIAV